MPICNKCKKEFPNWIKIEDKWKLLSSRKYCIECSPYGKHNTKKIINEYKEYYCKICGEENKEKFYIKGKKSYCKKCWNDLSKSKQRQNKEAGNLYLGNKCKKCGYDKCSDALHWHHINSSEKDENYRTKLSWSWNRLKKELDKCILLCANCHAEEHMGQ